MRAVKQIVMTSKDSGVAFCVFSNILLLVIVLDLILFYLINKASSLHKNALEKYVHKFHEYRSKRTYSLHIVMYSIC